MSNKDDESMKLTRNIGQLAKTRWTLFQLKPKASPSWAVVASIPSIQSGEVDLSLITLWKALALRCVESKDQAHDPSA